MDNVSSMSKQSQILLISLSVLFVVDAWMGMNNNDFIRPTLRVFMKSVSPFMYHLLCTIITIIFLPVETLANILASMVKTEADLFAASVVLLIGYIVYILVMISVVASKIN